MEKADIRLNEAQALEALRRFQVLDSVHEPEFDALVHMAAQVCRTPMAMVSLVDAQRLWFKAAVGLEGLSETPRDIGFCSHTVLDTALLEVPDTTQDLRFVGNPLVEHAPNIRFYAGAPILLSDGCNIGAVCVLDVVPRALDSKQRDVLQQLAVIAARLLEGRSALFRANETALEAQHAVSVLRHCTDAVLGMTTELDITWVNPAAEALLGESAAGLIGASFKTLVPPDRLAALLEMVQHASAGAPRPHDTQRQRRSGSLLDVTELFTKRTDTDGAVVGYMVFLRDIGERIGAARALESKESEQRFLFEHLTVGVFVHAPNGVLLHSNAQGARLLGLSEEVMSGKALMDPDWHFISRDGQRMPVADYPVARVLATGMAVHDLVLGVVSPYTERRTWLICDANREHPEQPQSSRIVVTVVDITRLMEVEQSLERSQKILKDMFDNALDPIMLGKPDGSITAANPAACRVLGMSAAEICSLGREAIMDSSYPALAAFAEQRAKHGAAQGELQMIRKGGEKFIVEMSSTIYRDMTGERVSSIFFRDVSERRAAQALATRLTYFDELTGLPNRRYLLDNLKQSLAASLRHGRIGGLVFIDLDNFKQVNDARGHLVGDELLKLVAARLKSCLRANDTLARLGGDEFIVLVDDLGSDFAEGAHNAALAAEKCRDALDHAFDIGNQTYKTSGSLGITLFPRDGQVADDILREADTAMYRAKSLGRNKIAFFGSTMQAEVESRLRLEYDLSEAIARGQLQAFVQPQFSVAGAVVGGEILLRWKHPQRGNVSPVDFIPVAESTGQILVIGDWVLQQAVMALQRLRTVDAALSLSVNVSPRQFLQEGFVANLCALLDASGVPGASLILEVTEGLLIQDWDTVQSRVRELMERQIRLSIDDFGTGYSSLAYLKRLPLYELKIDRGFVADIPHDPNDVAIVDSIISIAKHLGFKLVAEGVETQEQVDFLVSHGCDVLQGFLFARPMPLEDWLLSLGVPGPIGSGAASPAPAP